MESSLLLFTQISKDLYKRDVLNACCQASGTTLSFAYDKKWVAPGVRIAEFKGKNALLVLCERKARGTSRYTYHPIRTAKIVSVHDVGDFATFRLELSAFFAYDKYAEQVPETLKAFQDYATRGSACPSSPTPRYVRQDLPWDRLQTSAGWGALANHFATLEGLRGVTFFCMQPPDTFASPPAALFPDFKKDFPVERYLVRGGQALRLALWLVTAERDPIVPDVILQGDVGTVAGPLLHQRAEGIQATYFLQLKRSTQSTVGMIVVRSVRSPSATTGGLVISPELAGLLQLKPDRQILIVSSLLTIGSALSGFDAATLATWFQQLGASAEQASALGTVAKLVGAILVGIAAYLGFGRLPIPSATVKS
jgi:hypothetical protein